MDVPEREFDLRGCRVAIVGRLSGMAKRDAQRLIRQHGGVPVESPVGEVDLLVMGDEGWPVGEGAIAAGMDHPETRQRIEAGQLQVVRETELWERLGLVEREPQVQRLYTPAMLAELLGVPVAVVRRWHRRGLIVPAKEVRRLPYFDFSEVATARQLAGLLAAGVSPAAIERQLAALERLVPGVERPLAQLSVIVEGKELLLRQGDGLVDAGGQLRIDFEALPTAERHETGEERRLDDAEVAGPRDARELLREAIRLEDDGELAAAAEMYRAALAAGGPNAEACFLLAELLYRLGDLSAARERYAMAIEIDEDYVEARSNLGCVLADLGELELAAAAFEGALSYHGDYPDVHYHLARTLDELGRSDEAAGHWNAFLQLAPDSPWAEVARERLEGGASVDEGQSEA